MKICLVSQEYPPETSCGGVGTQTWNKARALAALGHTVHVLSCSAGEGPDLRTDTDAGVTVHRMRRPGVEFRVYQMPTYWVGYSWAVLRQLHRLLAEAGPFDVLDFPEYGAEGFAYQLDRSPWNWAAVVVQLHAPLAMFVEHIGWPERGSDFHRVGTLMEEISIRRADALMACSANIADLTAGYCGVPRESIAVVHCGVDAEAFRPARRRAARSGRPTVLFVGNLVGNKGVAETVEAVLRLRSKYPAIRLQILGGGTLMGKLQERVSAAEAEANIEFPGFVERAELPQYYQEADVFCSPAQYEGGVANVFIEAMACGCPVVASTAGGGPEAVAEGETGLLVPPGDVDAVARALDRILADAPLRRRMGRAARRRVEEYFAMDKYIQRVLAVYRRAIDRSRETLDRLKAQRGL
jgi:glycogen(starch) synthase